MTSPLAILTAAALNAAAAVRVDADTFAKLCERPDAQRFTLDTDADGVAFEGGVIVDGVAYRVDLDPLAILADAQRTPRAAAARVDADTFAKLCARPGAQRYIVNGSINADGTIKGDKAVIGVHLDGADYTVN